MTIKVGKMTQEWDEGIAYAKKFNCHVLLSFTGSDWCSWCEIMEDNVFATESWESIARDMNLVVINIDFPQNAPQHNAQQSKELREKYEVKGFPSYFVLSPTLEVLGQLRAGKRKTPDSFAMEIRGLISDHVAKTSLNDRSRMNMNEDVKSPSWISPVVVVLSCACLFLAISSAYQSFLLSLVILIVVQVCSFALAYVVLWNNPRYRQRFKDLSGSLFAISSLLWIPHG